MRRQKPIVNRDSEDAKMMQKATLANTVAKLYPGEDTENKHFSMF